jgi:cation transport protein ChaC
MTNKLSRDSIRDGDVYRMLKEQEHITNICPLTEAEREVLLDQFLEGAPRGPVWVFGYGSLIWNPAFRYTASRTARVFGYHRSFCIKTPLGRGSPEYPGLMLALDAGGSCNGVAFRLPAKNMREELSVVWAREMAIAGTYRAIWVRVQTAKGPINAVTFAINRYSDRYTGKLTEDELVKRLSTASGYLGTCAEYLENTVRHMHKLGIWDEHMFRLQRLVRDARSGKSD